MNGHNQAAVRNGSRWRSSSIIAGVDPAIHLRAKKMDPQVKPTNDGRRMDQLHRDTFPMIDPKGRTMMRRTILPALMVAHVFVTMPPAVAPATAQPYPNRPVKIIVPTPAGGPVDVMARLLANALPPVLGQNVIVENRAGPGNTLGSKVAAAAEPDGYTLLVSAASGLIMSPMVYKSAGYDENSFAPIALVAETPQVLVAHPAAPFNSVAELVAYAK